VSDKKRDELLNHEADGIREFDNALPRWWLYGFYFTIAFAAVYFVNYHLLPQPLFGRPGQVAEYTAEMEAAAAAGAGRPGAAAAGLAALTDPGALAKGEEIFMGQRNLCHTCHRKDLGGLVGPNLTDDKWLHGCTASEMVQNVKTGFPAKGMLPFGSAQPLTDEEVLQVVSFILTKTGSNPGNPKPVDPERDKECRTQ
jgi:cytochrome c oxidase cbb3-type subunit 3